MTSPEKIEKIAKYVITHKATVRHTAEHFKMSKSNIHVILRNKLKDVNLDLYENVIAILEKNKAERHIRGGYATKYKYALLRNKEKNTKHSGIHIDKSKISNLASDIDKQFANIRSNLGMGWDTSARREVFANTVDERSITEPKYVNTDTLDSIKDISVRFGYFAMNTQVDLDLIAFLLDKKGKCKSDDDIVFYNKAIHQSKSIMFSSNRIGYGDGDDEMFDIDLAKIPKKYHKIDFVINLYSAISCSTKLNHIKDAYIRVVNNQTHKEICRYNIDTNVKKCTSMAVGQLYRKDDTWMFKAIREPFHNGLKDSMKYYGLRV